MVELPEARLWVTVYEEDEQAADIWLNDIGVSEERFARIGATDNFWAMGDTGPCGPCTEIFYDFGENVAGGPPGTADQDGDRYVEYGIWCSCSMSAMQGEAHRFAQAFRGYRHGS